VTRRGSFERVYGLTERLIPCGRRTSASATLFGKHGLRDYFRLFAEDAKSAIETHRSGIMRPVEVLRWTRLRISTVTPACRDGSLPGRFSLCDRRT
jgi:uncharacterized protein YcaQ